MDGADWYQMHQAEIDDVVTKELETARISQFLAPAVNVPPQTRNVSLDKYDYEDATVGDDTFVDIERFSEYVEISKLQTDDPDPSRALTTIRRAVTKLARRHDERVLRNELADTMYNGEGKPGFHDVVPVEEFDYSLGEGMITAVASAIALLDGEGYRSDYGLVANNKIWAALHQRGKGSATLPIDAVKALLEGGTIRRSSVLNYQSNKKSADDIGVALVMSLGVGRVDRVVAESPRMVFVKQQVDSRTFDLYERYVPRFRETLSVVLLRDDIESSNSSKPAEETS